MIHSGSVTHVEKAETAIQSRIDSETKREARLRTQMEETLAALIERGSSNRGGRKTNRGAGRDGALNPLLLTRRAHNCGTGKAYHHELIE